MSRSLERNDNSIQEQAILAETFLRFYQQNDQFFCAQDKDTAKNYFNGEGENLSAEKLLERQRQCIAMCERSLHFASKQRKYFFDLLGSMPIAFDKKKTLRTQFLNGDFQVKTQLIEHLLQEEKRIATKREAQRSVIEALKNQFIAFYANNSLYFNEYDRESAIHYALSSIGNFKTHMGRFARLQMLLAMLPANLAYARELDEKYQSFLKQKIPEEQEREQMLERFRSGNFAHKNELLKSLLELVVIEKKKEDPEASEKKALLQKYKELHAEFPSDMLPENFGVLSLSEQRSTLRKKQEESTREQAFRKEKKEEMKEDPRGPSSTSNEKTSKELPENSVCSIAIRIIQNNRGKKYHDDKEVIKDIETEMKQDNISGSFSEENLKAMRSILPRLPQQYWGTVSAAAWVKKEMQSITVVHEYTT